MVKITGVCSACGRYGPIAMVATLGQGDESTLCADCAASPERVRAFVRRFDRACGDPDAVREARRYLATRQADSAAK